MLWLILIPGNLLAIGLLMVCYFQRVSVADNTEQVAHLNEALRQALRDKLNLAKSLDAERLQHANDKAAMTQAITESRDAAQSLRSGILSVLSPAE